MKEKIYKILLNDYTLNIIMMMILFLMFYLPELLFRVIYNSQVQLLYWNNASPNLFTFSYITILLGIIYFIPLKRRKIFYTIVSVLEVVLIVAQSIHFEILGRFFGFADLANVSEGSNYFLSSIRYFNPRVLIVIFAWLLFYLIANQITSKVKKVKFKYSNIVIITTVILVFLGFRGLADYKLGTLENEDDVILSTRYRYIYNSYDDNTKSYYISGFFEYLIRNPYMTLKKKYAFNYKEAYNYINEYVENNSKKQEKNEYTGIFENKNLIYIMLESVDSWLVNEEDMPNLYKLSNEGINFTNRYAPQAGSGFTLNTEFALNTGFYSIHNTPAYEFVNNNFSNALPNMFKNNGYTVNSVHANNGGFYSRTNLHKAYGYENHYDSYYMITLTGKNGTYTNDLNLVKEQELLDLIVPNEEKFMTFYTTYSVHLPYQDNKICNLEFDRDYTQMECVKYLASITDDMIETIVAELENKDILDDTVIVLASDHYMYGYTNKEELYDIKGTNDDNLLENVPLIIWSKDLKSETNDTYLGTVDILPTLLNMFGFEYDPNYYLGMDVYSKNYENYIWFMDNSYYDGVYYNETNFGNKEITELIKNKIKFNEYYLRSNYNDYLRKK